MERKVCFVVAVEITVKAFLLGHIRAISPYFAVYVAVNTQNRDFLKPFGVDVPVIVTGIERKISLLSDIKATIKLYKEFRKGQYDIIHSVTPKAGLLSMLAGYFADVPTRIHIFTGQVWATKTGIKRLALKTVDKVLAMCATNILVDSHSQREFLIRQGVVKEDKSQVLANGSICGVDTERFKPDPEARVQIRAKHGMEADSLVFLFVGRLTKDKGLLDLARAFSIVSSDNAKVHLLVVGPDEEGMGSEISFLCGNYKKRVHLVPYTDNPEMYMSASDVFCLPSYREGFGMVIIEAGSCGTPSIGSRIYGITDAIEEGVTGLFHEPGDVSQIVSCMQWMIDNREMREEMGRCARKRACDDFSKELVTEAFLNYYKNFF